MGYKCPLVDALLNIHDTIKYAHYEGGDSCII